MATQQPNSNRSLAQLIENFDEQVGLPTFGSELEFFIVDRKTGEPVNLFQVIRDALPESQQEHVQGEHLGCQLEYASPKCRTPQEFRDHIEQFLQAAQKAAGKHGAQLIWKAMHPTWRFDRKMVRHTARCRSNSRRLGPLERQLSSCGQHVHVKVSRGNAIKVVDRIQRFVPLLVALSANSPICEGRDTGRCSQRGHIWANGFAVSGICGPYRDWDGFNQHTRRLEAAGRIKSPKDLCYFVRPTTHGTVEVRCCDMPANPNQAVALAALIHTLVFALSEDKLQATQALDREFLRAELHEAITKGPEARLTNLYGNLVFPLQFLKQLYYELEPAAKELRNGRGALVGSELSGRQRKSVTAR